MPNSIIVVGTAITIGSAHVHHRYPRDEEDNVAVDGITKDKEDNEVEDVEGDSRIPKEYQRTLL